MILFLTLKVFSATGGIEKVCRVAGKALYEYGLQHGEPVRIFSMHGPKNAAKNNKYFPAEIFKGYDGKRFRFVKDASVAGSRSKIVILSHINLLLAGWLVKKMNPSVKLVLIAHGIEVWQPLTRHQKIMIKSCDEIIAVSSFTSEKIRELHHIPGDRISVINNCIDPFFADAPAKKRDALLMKRYGFAENDIILLTLTRLTERDRYKGYDFVIRAVEKLVKEGRQVKYLLAGSYDEKEKQYVSNLIKECGVEEHVILTGFIREEELPAHFSLADIYVMPSVKEGFGIVFVEAMYYGVPAIAANADGSVDALLKGKLGLLIEPHNPHAITGAINKMIAERERYLPDHRLLMEHFGYEAYKEKLEAVLD